RWPSGLSGIRRSWTSQPANCLSASRYRLLVLMLTPGSAVTGAPRWLPPDTAVPCPCPLPPTGGVGPGAGWPTAPSRAVGPTRSSCTTASPGRGAGSCSGFAEPGDEVGGGERLAGAGGPEEHLELLAVGEPVGELLDGLGLVAGRRVVADELELGGHRVPP